jgi:hypothetical protein
VYVKDLYMYDRDKGVKMWSSMGTVLAGTKCNDCMGLSILMGTEEFRSVS